MNRIILIGNGFDLAHGLKTSYKDFIDKYWRDFFSHIFNNKYDGWTHTYLHPYEDYFVSFGEFENKQYKTSKPSYLQSDSGPYHAIRNLIATLNDSQTKKYANSVRLEIRNKFFEHISNQCSLQNWVDIENEYYGKLKDLLAEDDATIRNQKILALNKDLDNVKDLLTRYLTQIVEETPIKPFHSIQKAFNSSISHNEVAVEKRKMFVNSTLNNYEERILHGMKHLPDKHFQKNNCMPSSTLILNFNYTHTAKKLYARDEDEIINIHGELDNQDNPIIFGYGDELDDDYKKISILNGNEYLRNIKSMRYLETDNYRNLLLFIDSAPFQIYIMGHSCGNSDRTLLNTLFEHKNCISIKPFYYEKPDGTDNYIEIIQNISRNFNDMRLMRDRVVNKTYCRPLVPIQEP